MRGKKIYSLCLCVMAAFVSQNVAHAQSAAQSDQIQTETQSKEFKSRNAAIENIINPQIELGDRFSAQKDYQSACDAYARALMLLDRSKLGNGKNVQETRNRINSKFTAARKNWGAAIFAKAKETYLASLVEKQSEKAISGFRSATRIALSAVPCYYSGKNEKEVSPTQYEKELKADPAFNDNVRAFVIDCEKMETAYNFKNETSLDTLDPDYGRRKKEILLLQKQAEIYYKTKQYEKARTNMEKVLVLDPYNQQATSLLNRIYKKLYSIGMIRSENDAIETMVEVEWKWSEPVPPTDATEAEASPKEISGTSADIYDKLQKIIVDRIEYEKFDIQSILEHLNKIAKQLDPSGVGVNIIPPSNIELRTRQIPYLELEQMPLLDVIKYVCEIAGIKYKIRNQAVIVGAKASDEDVEPRSFAVRKSLIQRIKIEAEPPSEKDSETEDSSDTLKDAETFRDKTLLEVKDEEIRKTPEVTPDMLKAYFAPMGITFDEGSTISYDTTTGKIITKNTPENHRKMETLLKEIDIPPPLVLVDSKVMEVALKTMEELGFDWQLSYTNTETNHKISFSGLSSSAFYRGNPSNYLINGLKLLPSFGDNHQFDLAISVRALDQKDRTEILATPRLLVASGYNGKLVVAEDRYFPDDWEDPEVEIVNGTSYTYNPPIPEFGDSTPVGTTFTVTPTVSSNNYTILLNVNTDLTRMTGWSNYDYSIVIGGLMVSIADRSTTNLQPKMKMPIFSKRKISSTVKIYDGETVVIGGILEDIQSRREDKIPLLGDIPLIGRLFTDSSTASEKTNLMVFVTARLMKGNGLPVRDARKQGLFEFNDR